MCVAITLDPGAELSLAEIEKMNKSNADGVGVAWARNGMVHWFKTTKVDPEYIRGAVASWKDYPRLVHFRFATAGGTRPDLCHPFEISARANCAPTGRARQVMIHNGHWSRWNEVKELLEKEDLLPDAGPWSDTRLAAYLAHEDPEWLTTLGGRVAVLRGSGEITRLGDWTKLRNGVQVSNKLWEHQGEYKRGGYSGYRAWKGWDWDEDEYSAFFKEQAELKAQALAELLKEKKEDEKRESARQKKRDRRRTRRGGGEGFVLRPSRPGPMHTQATAETAVDNGACTLVPDVPEDSQSTD